MGTKDDIVRIATDYIQRNGVSGFSYADIARKMNIKKPSIHYYFPVKSDLVRAAFEKYSTDFLRRYARAWRRHTASAKNSKSI